MLTPLYIKEVGMRSLYQVYGFVGVQIILVLLYIYKESAFIALSYEHQKQEKMVQTLKLQQQEKLLELQKLQQRSAIQQLARQTYQLEPLTLASMRRLNVQQPS